MNGILCVVFVLALRSAGIAAGASDGAGSPSLFGLDRVLEFRLTFSEEAWNKMEPVQRQRPPLERGPAPDRPPGREREPREDRRGMNRPPMGPPGMMDRDYPWSECRFEGLGVSLTNLAIRFKGNSSYNISRNALKRPMRLDFNRGASGRSLLGIEEMSLNNNVNDATGMREALAFDIYRRMGVPAPRTAFVRVYITITGVRTNDYAGLYTLIEGVGADFLKDRFGSKSGLLMKPERMRGLEYLGEDWEVYNERYEAKRGVKKSEVQRVVDLARLVERADDATFIKELPERIALDEFLRFIAVTSVVANYDSFLGNGHNYYLYQPTKKGRAIFIPWDLNEAFGGHPPAGSRQEQAEFSVLNPTGASNRLIERVLSNPEWQGRYRQILSGMLTNAFDPERIRKQADAVALVIRDAAFEESPFAKASFQRIALGQTNVVIPNRFEGLGPGPRPGGPGIGMRPGEDRPGPGGQGPERRGPPGPGGIGPGSRREEGTLAQWVQSRVENIRAELDGKRTGTVPQRQRNGFGGPPLFRDQNRRP